MDSIPAKPGHRVLIFVESDNGFGHFNIVDQLAQKIKEQGGETAIASGTFFHPGGVFEYGGAQQYHLPTVVWNSEKRKFINPVSGKNYEDESHFQSLRKEQIKKTCAEFKPDVILFELYPFMFRYRDHDLNAIKELYPDPKTRPKTVSLARDIIHSANPLETVKIINEDFDHLLVRGDGILNKLEDCMPEYKDIAKRPEYLGNIVSPMPPRDAMPDAKRPVLIFSGGGYKKEMDVKFFELSIQARKHSEVFSKNPWIVVVSNNCSSEEFAQYEAMAKREAPDGSIQVLRPTENEAFRKLTSNSAAAIVRGSYNTTFELVQVGVPFVVIPRLIGTTPEQIFRANVLESAGFAKHVPQDKLDPGTLSAALDEAAISRSSSLLKLDFSGAERIAARLKEIASERTRPLEEIPGVSIQGATGGPALEESIHRVRA